MGLAVLTARAQETRDLRALAEDHAVGVHQPHMAIRLDGTVDLRGLAVMDAVERDR